MSNQYAENYTINPTTANNSFSAIWKLTRCMKASGWTYMASGDGTSKDTTGVATADLWGANADPMLDAYAGAIQAQLDSRAAWWCAEGPIVAKIGIGAASSGTFIRGEFVSQAGSGATGEILGYVINGAGNSGWLVIMPHTGTFNGTGVVTGADSGATVTATSYVAIRQQVVIAKNTTVTTGWIFYEALSQTEIDASANTALFSDLAVNAANCTATVAPGNSSSGSNRWPSYGIPGVGTPEGAGQPFFGITSGFGKAHLVSTNVTPSAGITADGTWFAAIWDTANSVYRCLSLLRLDKTEPGDVNPWILQSVTSESSTSATAGRAAATTSASATAMFLQYLGTLIGTPAKGYCARTTGTMGTPPDAYTPFVMGITGVIANSAGNQGIAQCVNATHPPKIRNHPDVATTGPYPIERCKIVGKVDSLTIRKGVCRWFGTHPAASINDTIDTKQWLVIVANATTNNPALIIGPLDGTTTPTTT